MQALFQTLHQWQSLRRPHESPSHCSRSSCGGATTPSAQASLLLLLRRPRFRRNTYALRAQRKSQEKFQILRSCFPHCPPRPRERDRLQKPNSQTIQTLPETAADAGTDQLHLRHLAGGRPRHVPHDALARPTDPEPKSNAEAEIV